MVFYLIIRRLLPTITIPNSNSMRIRLYTGVWLLSLFIFSVVVRAQSSQTPDSTQTPRGPYTLVVTVGSGFSYYSTHLRVPTAVQQTQVSRFGVPATLRLMWYPDHRLRIGLETGWTTMYSYRGHVSGEPVRTYVSVIPALIVFSMPLAWLSGTERTLTRRLAVTVGTGAYINHSRLDYAGTVQNNSTSLGWMVAGSYTRPVGRRFRVAGELKWYDAVGTENAAFLAELQLVWRAFSW